MKVVLQRVKNASIKVNEKEISKIRQGLLLFLGVGKGDSESQIDWLVNKIINLRIFEDEQGKMNKSLLDIDGEILLVSQFTLYADCSKGRRPSFTQSENPERANELYKTFGKKLAQNNVTIKYGIFGADMKVSLLNDGPVTIILER